ncbi:hypothetical protein RCL1_004178 [Eukaryota sp. TZLM3-RCL]
MNNLIPPNFDLGSSDESDYDPNTLSMVESGTIPKQKGGLKGEAATVFGKANMAFLSGNTTEAIQLLEKAAQLAPTRPEPYKTLVLVYESINDHKRAVASMLMAASRSRDAYKWEELAETAKVRGFPDIESYALSKALLTSQDNFDLHVRRAQLLILTENKSDHLKAVEHLTTAIRLDPFSPEPVLLCAKIYMEKLGKTALAQSILEQSTMRFIESNLTPDWLILNQYCELLIHQSFYKLVYDTLEKVVFVMIGSELKSLEVSTILTSFPPDIGTKLIISMLYLRIFHENFDDDVLRVVLNWDLIDYRDLIESIALAALESESVDLAFPLFLALSSVFSDSASILTGLGRCHLAINDTQSAISTLIKAVEYDPSPTVKLFLSEALRQSGQIQLALSALSDGITSSSTFDCFEELKHDQDQTLLFIHRVQLLYSQQLHHEFLSSFLPFLCCIIVNSKGLRVGRTAPLLSIPGLGSLITTNDLIDLVMKTSTLLFEQNLINDALLLLHSFVAYATPFLASSVLSPLSFVVVKIAFHCSNYSLAYNAVREVLARYPNNMASHMICSAIVTKLEDTGFHQKYILRHANNRSTVPFLMSLAVNYMSHGSAVLALPRLLKSLLLSPAPFIYFCLGTVFANLSRRKQLKEKQRFNCVFNSFLFFKHYENLMGNNLVKILESRYNQARLFHSVGLLSLAIKLYKEVLKTFDENFSAENFGVNFSVEKEAAFNLVKIYQHLGQKRMAYDVMCRYLIV